MMRKRVGIGVLAAGLFVFTPLFSTHGVPQETEKYADAKEVLEKLAAALERFVEDMNKADNSKAISECLNAFTVSMSELVPGLNEIRQKYPELKDETTHPDELKPLLKRVDKNFAGMMRAYGKVKENLSDPAVKESENRYKEVMAQLR